MKVDSRLAQIIRENEIRFNPWFDRFLKETGISIFNAYPLYLGKVTYRPSTNIIESEIKYPELEEILEEVVEVISEKLKIDKDAYITFRSLKNEIEHPVPTLYSLYT